MSSLGTPIFTPMVNEIWTEGTIQTARSIGSNRMVVIARVDPELPTPLYRQLRDALEESIIAGRFGQGRLPSSRALAADLGLSRNTVNLAYQELIVDGFVATRPRSGFFVNDEIQQQLRREQPAAAVGAGPARRPSWDQLITPGPPDPFAEVGTPDDWSSYPYPFLSSQVDPLAFPRRAWSHAMREALMPRHAVASLQDSRQRDDELLVDHLCSHVLPARGIRATPEQILVTIGSQHAFYLIGRTLVRPGTRVAVENPGWADAAVILESAGAEVVAIEVDDGGLTMTTALRHVRLVCVTPNHQFPSGVTLGIARRRELLEIAVESNSLVIEDDYERELRYQGRPTPAFKAIDTCDRVIHVGSFSKFLAPGLRLGFVVAAPELVDEMRRWRRVMVRHPAGILQRALGLFIASGDYQRWLRHYRVTMKRKWERIVSAAAVHLPWPIAAQTGGTGLWVTGPVNFDSRDLRRLAAHEGVLLEQGQPAFRGYKRPVNSFRLGFAAIRQERIEPGMEIIGRIARELTDR